MRAKNKISLFYFTKEPYFFKSQFHLLRKFSQNFPILVTTRGLKKALLLHDSKKQEK